VLANVVDPRSAQLFGVSDGYGRLVIEQMPTALARESAKHA